MQTQIDNIPHIKPNNVSTNLGKTQPTFSVIKGFESKQVFSPTSIESMSNINFDTIIKTNKDTNTYEVLTDPIDDDSSNEKDEKKEGEDGDIEEVEVDVINIQTIFKHDLNYAFIGTLSILGLFILYRMIQKSR
jgi:hypothetical protein